MVYLCEMSRNVSEHLSIFGTQSATASIFCPAGMPSGYVLDLVVVSIFDVLCGVDGARLASALFQGLG